VGNACWTEHNSDPISVVNASERVQHGLINVLVPSLPQHRIRGLQRQFSENIDAVGLHLNMAGQIEACKNICYSNVRCTVWQSYYNDGTGSDLGCWIENPGVPGQGIAGNEGGVGNYLPYPLTTAQFEDNTNEQYIVGGEFIQHHCPIPSLPLRPAATTTTTAAPAVLEATPIPPTAAPPATSFWNPWGMLLLAAAVLAAVAALVCYMTKEEKPKKTQKRAIKPIKKEPPPPPAPPLPQPIVPLVQQIMMQPTIAQPLPMTMIQQPVTVAAQAVAQPVLQSFAAPAVMAQPMATYAGSPQYRPM